MSFPERQASSLGVALDSNTRSHLKSSMPERVLKVDGWGMGTNIGAGQGIRNRPEISVLSNGEEAEAMYDQYEAREHRGEPQAHLSVVSYASQTDSRARAARGDCGNRMNDKTFATNVTGGRSDAFAVDVATGDVALGRDSVDSGAEDADDLDDIHSGSMDSSVVGVDHDSEDVVDEDDTLEEGTALPVRVPEKPFLSMVAGFDRMFEEIEDQWQERALCAQTDPEAFFPEKGGSTREAKRICLGCDVKGECLEYALAKDERFGIWGGLSERERRRLKRGIS